MSERLLRWLEKSVAEIAGEVGGVYDSRAVFAIRLSDEIRAEAVRQGFSREEIEEENERIADKVAAIDPPRFAPDESGLGDFGGDGGGGDGGGV